MSRRIQALLESYFSLKEKWFIDPHQVQKILSALLSVPVSHRKLHRMCSGIPSPRWLFKGISLAAVEKILGRDRLATTAIYLNLTDTHVVDEYSQKW